MKTKAITLLLPLIMVAGCGTGRNATETPERVIHDTVYIGRQQYDSIYRNGSFRVEYRPSHETAFLHDSTTLLRVDTVFIRDTKVEYKYRHLHDTVSIHRVDTIPIVHEVEVTREVEKPLGWIDRTGRTLLLLLLCYALVSISSLLKGRSWRALLT